jgi:hypothetical protein
MSRIASSFVPAMVLLCFIAQPASAENDELTRRLARAVKSGQPTVDLRAIATDFEWDKLFRFPPYTSREAIETALGFAWPDADRSAVSEIPSSLCLIVFTKDKRVVHWLDVPESIADFSFIEDYALPREQTLFRVEAPSLEGPVLWPASRAPARSPATSTTSQPANEIVMTPGTSITASTPQGTITITAGKNLKRSYTWEGATRSVTMWPRQNRWYGSLGLYYPGPGEHWVKHNGITRAVVEEGQQHFATEQQAIDWLHARTYLSYVWRTDGLVVGWSKTPERRQLSVEVWQIIVDGKQPTQFPGSADAKISVAMEAIPGTRE